MYITCRVFVQLCVLGFVYGLINVDNYNKPETENKYDLEVNVNKIINKWESKFLDKLLSYIDNKVDEVNIKLVKITETLDGMKKELLVLNRTLTSTRNDSRIEYAKLPARQLEGFNLTMEFRTSNRHGGLVFYAHADKNPQQFLAFYMQDAKLHFTFNCGGETATVSSMATYNDSEWHTVTLARSGGHGKLTVDSEPVGEASVACPAPALLTPPYYYGGLKELTYDISLNLQGFYQPFKGCLKGLMMNDKAVTDVALRVNSLRCTDSIEEGVYFGASDNAHSNYLKLMENFKVGYEVLIAMEVRSRNSTGLLLSVHGERDFLVLEMLENKLEATVENGDGPFRATFKLPNNNTLCDGNWHKIHVVKSLYVVSVGVDGHFSRPGIGTKSSSSTDTCSALYVGGHERPLHEVPGVRSRRGFTGCMRNLFIGQAPVPIPLTAIGRNAHIGVCPLD